MISSTGIWSEELLDHHIWSETLLNHLKTILSKDIPVLDFGCGKGNYIYQLSKLGYKVLGIEGTKELASDIIITKDLTRPVLAIPGQVLSFEVGEHIPEQYEQIFLDNITYNCSSTLVISWAVLGQGGLGHVNCKDNDYIIGEITRRGFTYNKVLTEQIRSGDYTLTPWFGDTLMVFNKD